MERVTVSPKYQVVIPLSARERLGLKPGQKLQVICHDGRLELLPVQPMAAARGLLRGMDTTLEREPDRL